MRCALSLCRQIIVALASEGQCVKWPTLMCFVTPQRQVRRRHRPLKRPLLPRYLAGDMPAFSLKILEKWQGSSKFSAAAIYLMENGVPRSIACARLMHN
jgi:hypothetical protein